MERSAGMRHLILCTALLCAGEVRAASGEITLFEVRFAEGLWAFSQNDNVSAVERFREALEVRPGDGLARYLLGLSHLRLGELQDAEREIAASLEADPPPPIERSRILADLQAARTAGEAATDLDALASVLRGKDRESPRWGGSLSLMAVHDSNPNLMSGELVLSEPGSGDELVDGRSSDLALGADLRVGRRPIRLPAGWGLALDLRGGGTLHQDFEYLDMTRAGGTVQLGRQVGRRWSLLLHAGGEETRLDGSPYLRAFDGGASVAFALTAADSTRLDVRLLDRRYARHTLADPRRDGQEVRIALRQTRYFGSADRYVAFGVSAADRRAEREFERTLMAGEVQAALPLGPRLALDVSGWLSEEDFGDPASNLFDPQGTARYDRTRGASATLSYSVTGTVRAQVRGLYIERSSNADMGEDLPDLDYRRMVLGTGVVWTF